MGYCTRSEYPHRLLILAINSLFYFASWGILRLTQISQIPQVLLLRALNLTEVGGYRSAPSALSALINKVPTNSPRG